MRARRNKRLAFLMSVLLAAVLFSLFIPVWRDRPEVDPDLFRVDEMEKIDRVELLSPGDTVVLRFDGVRWMVNEKYDADRQMIRVLFATLSQVVPKRPISENLKEQVRLNLEGGGVKVRLFKGQHLAMEFAAGGNDRKTEAYFLPAGGSALVVGIPGYHVYASGVFEQQEGDWRDKRIFDLNWRNFKSLTTEFRRESEQDFTIALQDRYYGIAGLDPIDTARVNDYLDAVSLLECQRFYQGGQTPWIDSLLQVQPSFSIRVTDIAGGSYVLQIFPPLRRENTVVGKVQGDPVLFGRSDIMRIAKKRTYFRKSDPESP